MRWLIFNLYTEAIMQRSIYLWLYILFFIAGCGADGTEAIPQVPVNPDTPTLAPIGDKMVNVGDTLSFAVTANDPNNLVLMYATVGNMVASKDPYDAGNGNAATYNAGNNNEGPGQFNWDATGVAPGDYTVEFSVMNTAGLSDKETIKITVQDKLLLGKALYDVSCGSSSCHGPEGLTDQAMSSAPDVQCIVDATYLAKINGNGSMAIYVSSWSTTDKGLAFYYLQNVARCP